MNDRLRIASEQLAAMSLAPWASNMKMNDALDEALKRADALLAADRDQDSSESGADDFASGLQSELTEAIDARNAAEQRARSLDGIIANGKADNERLVVNVNEARAKVAALESEIAALKADREQCNIDYCFLRNQSDAQLVEIAALKADVTTLGQFIVVADRQVVALKAELSDARDERTQADTDRMKAEAELAKYTRTLTDAQKFTVTRIFENSIGLSFDDFDNIDAAIREVRGK